MPDREEADLVGSIITLSNRLKLETVAEGVERWSQLARLRSPGANVGQGEGLAAADEAKASTVRQPGTGSGCRGSC